MLNKGFKMNNQKQILLSALLFSAVSVLANSARIEALVVDDATGKPIEDVEVTATFWMETKWHQINGGADPNIVHLRTDANGRCKASGMTDTGYAGCFIRKPPYGYYQPNGGGGCSFTNKNSFGIWHPDDMVVTLRLQRVEHPLPLFVKHVGAYGYGMNFDGNSREDLFSKGNGVLQFDFMKGEWLPPIGNGETADVEFRRLPHEDLGEGVNVAGVKGRSYRDSMSVKFLGEGNGLMEMKNLRDAGLKVRMAPAEGFSQDLVCWHTKGKDLQPIDSFNKERCFCFRIRTRRNDKGEIIEAYYGKIYGDIQMLAMVSPYVPVASVRMLYYLNPRSLDRNLEWNRQNLCIDPIYPRTKDRWSYKTFNQQHTP